VQQSKLFIVDTRGSTIHGERAVVFPLPQWLRERATMCYTYNCLLFIKLFYKPKRKLLLEQREGFCEQRMWVEAQDGEEAHV